VLTQRQNGCPAGRSVVLLNRSWACRLGSLARPTRWAVPEYGRDVASVDHSGDDSELLEGGSDRPLVGRSGWWALGVAAAALIGLLIGYAVGHHRAPTRTIRAAVPTTSATHAVRSALPVVGPPFAQTGATCSVQNGRRLQLGIQIENQTSSIVHITGVGTSEPLHGLHPLATRVGACGELRGLPVSFDPSAVTTGAATWLTATVQVLVRCPAPYPVQFVVHYRHADHASIERLAGFVDLGHVPYPGCARTP
jgi:hypothetical protein